MGINRAVIQWSEEEPHKLLVVGSNPTRATQSSLDAGGSYYIEKIGMGQCCTDKQSTKVGNPRKGEVLKSLWRWMT